MTYEKTNLDYQKREIMAVLQRYGIRGSEVAADESEFDFNYMSKNISFVNSGRTLMGKIQGGDEDLAFILKGGAETSAKNLMELAKMPLEDALMLKDQEGQVVVESGTDINKLLKQKRKSYKN